MSTTTTTDLSGHDLWLAARTHCIAHGWLPRVGRLRRHLSDGPEPLVLVESHVRDLVAELRRHNGPAALRSLEAAERHVASATSKNGGDQRLPWCVACRRRGAHWPGCDHRSLVLDGVSCLTCAGLGYLLDQCGDVESDLFLGYDWIPLERCDDCQVYDDDLTAARAAARQSVHDMVVIGAIEGIAVDVTTRDPDEAHPLDGGTHVWLCGARALAQLALLWQAR